MPSLPRSPFGRRSRAVVETTPDAQEPRVEIVESPGLRWINIERPRSLEQNWLEEHFDFHALDYEDVRSRNQRPKVDEYDDYLFIVLHFPRYDKTVSRLNAAEVDIFVGPDYLITLPNEPLQPISYLFDRVRSNEELRENLFSKGAGYLLYKIVDDSVDASFPMLRKMGNKLERIEEDIFEDEQAEVVRDISNVKQEIINFRKIVRPQRVAFRDLERTKTRYIADDLDIYFEDIVDASERIWDMLENYKEVVEALEETNESAISHRSNEVFRILTAFSVIFLPYATTMSGRVRSLVVYALQGRYDVQAVDTQSKGHAIELCREAAHEGYDVVVAFGGDGTVNEAANGLVGSPTPLTCLPGGATNVYGRMLGIPNDVVDATEHLLGLADAWRERRVDLGRLDDRRFVFSAGMGLDASVVERVDSNPRLKARFGPWYFAQSAVRTFLRRYLVRPPRLEVEVGGKTVRGVSAFVQNGDLYTYF